jgi:hypothetical protein
MASDDDDCVRYSDDDDEQGERDRLMAVWRERAELAYVEARSTDEEDLVIVLIKTHTPDRRICVRAEHRTKIAQDLSYISIGAMEALEAMGPNHPLVISVLTDAGVSVFGYPEP